jgi:hypothetical protein
MIVKVINLLDNGGMIRLNMNNLNQIHLHYF